MDWGLGVFVRRVSRCAVLAGMALAMLYLSEGHAWGQG